MVFIVVFCLPHFVLSCLSEGFERSAQASLAIATVGIYYFIYFLFHYWEDDILDAIYEGASCEGLEMEIYNLEDKVIRERERAVE